MNDDKVHLILEREDAEWLQRAIALAKHETENVVVESMLDAAILDERRSLHVTHTWPSNPNEVGLSTVYERNGVTFDDTMQALLDVTESLMMEAAGIEFDDMRTPLSPALSPDDRLLIVFLNARMGLVHHIMSRPPTRPTVTS